MMQSKKPYELAAEVVPSPRQLEWQKLEMYAFAHFGTNTFTGKEWGDGKANPKIFNPKKLDAEQWIRELKNAGFKGLILTCKHHDGFCLWPSKYTDYSVKSSPYKDGKGDVVREVADACKKYGIKFGAYLSPWDRHEKTYGMGKEYNDFYVNQLTELCTEYGDMFTFWFDGACGEGANGKKQDYDWDRYIETIRKFQPNAVISICGPDVRWCGNESGDFRESEWSVVPQATSDQDAIAENSQKVDDGKFVKPIDQTDRDLGSRKAIENATNLIWYPSETDVSIRPGWFYHKLQDFKVKSVDKLMDIYWGTVGGNSALLLNIPPNKDGLFTKYDVKVLRAFGQRLRDEFPENLVKNCTVTSSSELDSDHTAQCILKENSYWQCGEMDENPEIIFDFKDTVTADKIVLRENIATGQQIENFTVFAYENNEWKKLTDSTVIGAKRICRFKKQSFNKLKIVITSYRVKATLSDFEIYCRA